MDTLLIAASWQLTQKEQYVKNAKVIFCNFFCLRIKTVSCMCEDYQENTKLASGYYSHLLEESN